MKKTITKILTVSILSATMFGSIVSAELPAGFPPMTQEQKDAFGSMMSQMSPQETELMQKMMKSVTTKQKRVNA